MRISTVILVRYLSIARALTRRQIRNFDHEQIQNMLEFMLRHTEKLWFRYARHIMTYHGFDFNTWHARALISTYDILELSLQQILFYKLFLSNLFLNLLIVYKKSLLQTCLDHFRTHI